jgi:membrane fusion protein (multidrug efflux system)
MKSLPLIALCAALGACNKPPAMPPRGPVEVGVATLKTQPVPLQAQLSGRTVSSLESDVRPQVSGLVKARRFEEGAQVREGQVLYELDPALYEAAVAQAEAALANAQAAVSSAKAKTERYADLEKIEGVSRQDADDARVAYDQALATVAAQKAALATARINLAYTQIRAPISGRIGKSSVTPGALVTASQTTALATIRALDPIYVDLTQSSAALLQLRKALADGKVGTGSADVRLTLEDGSDYGSPGTLKFSEVAVDESTGTVTLRAQFPNPKGLLLPGMFVRAELEQAVDSRGILAPQQGISRDAQGNATALVVDAAGRVRARVATTARAIGDKWLVTQGLAAGDRVIVEGANKVRVGDAVTAVEVGADVKTASAQAANRGQ